MKRRHGRELSRRDFLRKSAQAGGLAVSPLAIQLAGCGGGGTTGEDDGTVTGDETSTGPSDPRESPPVDDSPTLSPDSVLFGLYSSADAPTGADAVRRALANVDFSWLGPGDSVLLKVAANSGNPHPATTSPEAIRGVAAELFERGAGRVIVGEQSGVEWVRLTPDGSTFSSTGERLETAGMLEAIDSSGAEAHYFEAQGYDAFFEATPPPGSHWTEPLMLPNIIREVDHIVYLPRLSSHVLAGYTTGHKLSIGWLREDSRNHVHHAFDTFYEKYTEVNYVEDIQSRHRLTVTLAESMLLHFGPDDGTVHPVDPRIVIVSQNLANHELVAVATFLHANQTVAGAGGLTYTRDGADGINQFFVFDLVPQRTGFVWGPGQRDTYVPLVVHAFEDSASQDRALMRAWDLVGGRPSEVDVVLDGQPPSSELRSFLETHSEQTIVFS